MGRQALAAGVFPRIDAAAGDVLRRLPVDGVSVAVYGGVDSLERLSATDRVAAGLEELQFVVGEGPGRDSYRERCTVLANDLANSSCLWRWPGFARDAAMAGAHAVYAFPLIAGPGAPVGTALLYRAQTGTLTNRDITEAGRAVRALTRTVLEEVTGSGRLAPTPDDPDPVFGQSSVPLATGMLAAQLGLNPTQALSMLRAAAYAGNRLIAHLADDVITGRYRVTTDTR